MRVFVLAMCLGLCVSCQLVEPQYVALEPAQVAALEAQLGDLETANAELLRAAVEKLTGMQVESATKLKDELLVKLSPPAQEIATEAAETFLDRIIADPTATGAGAALMAAITAGLAAWRRRKAASAVVAPSASPEVKP